MNPLGIRYLFDRLPDAAKHLADEMGLVAIGLLLALGIWRSMILTRSASARERMRMQAAAWSILRDPKEADTRREPTRE